MFLEFIPPILYLSIGVLVYLKGSGFFIEGYRWEFDLDIEGFLIILMWPLMVFLMMCWFTKDFIEAWRNENNERN